jgi:hypothetical protein
VNFPKVKRTDAFILNTRGGLKLFRLYLPGLSGVAQLLPALILSLKGFRIVGMQILNGKRKYKALLSLPFDIAIIPVAVGYYLMGRFFLAKTLWQRMRAIIIARRNPSINITSRNRMSPNKLKRSKWISQGIFY